MPGAPTPLLPGRSGAYLFARYAYAPNLLGYCGPRDAKLLEDLMAASSPPLSDLVSVAGQFEGAYPYLELIAGATNREPLDRLVVEAYWTGNWLLRDVDTLLWGNAIDERFRKRAGRDWGSLERAILRGGLPTHAFHVFCVYPWVGLLRAGTVSPALDVVDRCRISWGTVVATAHDQATVRSQRLRLEDGRLVPGTPSVDQFRLPSGFDAPDTGDVVSLHWDTVCERLTPAHLAALRKNHDRHLAMANGELRIAGHRS
jgi:Family of unknown function (DUF6390)